MSNCERMDEQLNDFVDGLLSDTAARDVTAHLETCAACRDTLSSLRALKAEAAALPDIQGEELAAPEMTVRGRGEGAPVSPGLDFDATDDGFTPNFGKMKDDLDVPAFLRKQMD